MALRRTLPVLVALAALGAPAGAHAVTREQAVASALAGHDAPGAVVHVTPAPLAAGSRVVEAGPGAWQGGRSRVVRRDGLRETVARLKPWVVAKPAWLIWQDLAPGAMFMHPGRLVLIDDARGRVVAQRPTVWWPRVDGLDPTGFGTSEHKFAFGPVASAPAALRASAGWAHAAQETSGEPAAPLPEAPLPALPHDCMVTVGDRIDPWSAPELGHLPELAKQIHLAYEEADGVVDVARKVESLRKRGC